MRILIAVIAAAGFAFLSAYGTPACNPYPAFSTQCAMCDNDSAELTLSILHYNPIVQGYEFPSQYHVGQTYFLNAYVPNDNYCKKTTTIEQEYQRYKSESTNYTSTKYEDLKFSYIVQISKLGNVPKITYLDNFDGVVSPGDKKIHAFEWIPQEGGQYLIERFIFYDMNTPIPLAPKYSTYVDVSGMQKQQSAFMSPIEQFKYGASLAKSRQSDDLIIAIKSSNGIPVSVTPHTKQMLIERGWAKPI